MIPKLEAASSGPMDPFDIDISMEHPTWDPVKISGEFSLDPNLSWKRGDRFGNVVKGSSRWYGQLARGSGEAQYESALERVVSFLAKHEAFLVAFRQGQGEIEIVLNHAVVELPPGLALDLHLSSTFLSHLSRFGVGLRVHAWTDNPSWKSEVY